MEIQKIFRKWNEIDKTCSCCGQVTEKVRGITKQNIKRMVRLKPSSLEWTLIIFFLLFILIMLLYRYETAQCKEVIKDFKKLCIEYYGSLISNNSYDDGKIYFNITNQNG